MKNIFFITIFIFLNLTIFAQRYYVCMGSFYDENNAIERVYLLKDLKIDTNLKKIVINGVEYFRVVYYREYLSRESAVWQLQYIRIFLKNKFDVKDFWIFLEKDDTQKKESIEVKEILKEKTIEKKSEEKIIEKSVEKIEEKKVEKKIEEVGEIAINKNKESEKNIEAINPKQDEQKKEETNNIILKNENTEKVPDEKPLTQKMEQHSFLALKGIEKIEE